MTVLYAMVFAHFLSDFVLQSDGQVTEKRALKGSAYLVHGGVITTAMLALAWGASGNAYVALAMLVGLLHVAQDLAKDSLRARLSAGAGGAWIAADQILHLVVIGVLVSIFGIVQPLALVPVWLRGLHQPVTYEAATLVVLGTWVAGILLREALAPLVPQAHRLIVPTDAVGSQAMAETVATKSTVMEASKSETFDRTSFWIGIVERVIVIASVAFAGGQGLATAGLVVAAKSIFRWRDVDANPHAAQYFLLGTLASIAVAVVDGLLVRRVLGGWAPL